MVNTPQLFKDVRVPHISERRPAPRCEAEGCQETTRNGKPFCTNHVEHLPYVADLIDTLDARDAELARVQRRGARCVDPTGITAQEILLQLKLYGGRTIARLSRDLMLEEDVVESYGRALAKLGAVSIGRHRRGLLLHPEDLGCVLRRPSAETAA
ncbi:MAG: hypothetical protein R3F62_20455 [Planctomycetota bacterium]